MEVNYRLATLGQLKRYAHGNDHYEDVVGSVKVTFCSKEYIRNTLRKVWEAHRSNKYNPTLAIIVDNHGHRKEYFPLSILNSWIVEPDTEPVVEYVYFTSCFQKSEKPHSTHIKIRINDIVSLSVLGDPIPSNQRQQNNDVGDEYGDWKGNEDIYNHSNQK